MCVSFGEHRAEHWPEITEHAEKGLLEDCWGARRGSLLNVGHLWAAGRRGDADGQGCGVWKKVPLKQAGKEGGGRP